MSHSKVRWDFWNIISGGLMVLFLIFLVYPVGRSSEGICIYRREIHYGSISDVFQ